MGGLDVDPPRLAGAGRALDAKTDALASAVQTLQTALSSSGQMCGNDMAGKVFARSYRQGGEALFSAAGAAVNACRNVGYGIEVSAANYAQGEAASTLGGGEPSVQPPSAPAKFSGPTMPNPFGPAVGEPLLWSIVSEFVGSPWPDGNPATLRTAAGAWRSFGGAVAGVSGAIAGCSAEVSGHDIPELANIVTAVNQLSTGVGDFEKQCQSIASSLDSFAGEVEASQQAIRDLLHRLSLSGVLEELGRIFSGHDPMEDVKRVANDIKTVLHTLSREADASSAMFQAAIADMDSLTTQFENWTRKEFTHFLGKRVGDAAADLYNSDVDLLEGVVKSGFEAVGGVSDLVTHPQRLADLVNEANPGMQAARMFTNPKGYFEQKLDVVKGLVDAKDWGSDHPLRGLGDNIGTLAQFFIPGAGEAKAGAEGARAADEAAQAAKAEGRAADGLLSGGLKSDVAGQGSRIAHDLDGIKATPAQPDAAKPVDPGAARPADPGAVRPAEPAPGRPADLGTQRPAEPGAAKPVDPGIAKPAEPGAAGGGRSPGDAPQATDGVHEPAPAGSGGAPAEHAPRVPDPASAHVPAAPEGHGPSAHDPGGSGPHSGGPDGVGGAPHDPGGGAPHGDGDSHAPGGGDVGSPHVEQPAANAPAPKVEGFDYGLSPQHAFDALAHDGDELARLHEGGVPHALTEGYDPLAGRSLEEFQREFTVDDGKGGLKWDWEGQAPNNGFAGPPDIADHIPKGYQLDRFGSNRGGFMADEGAPLASRGMPPGIATDYHRFVGTGRAIPDGLPWEVRYGPAKDAFGQPGGANQWVVVNTQTEKDVSIEELITRRLITEIRR